MLDLLKKVKDEKFDSLSFLPGEGDNDITFHGSMYKDPGEKIGGSELGDEWHILIFRISEKEGLHDLDWFQGILTSPLEYVSELVVQKYYGIIAKNTTTSGKFVQQIFDKFSET